MADYYISTGETGAMYTLRYKYVAGSYDKIVKRDEYIKSLRTTDHEVAIKKAKEYFAKNCDSKLDTLSLSVPKNLRKITRVSVEKSLKIGKYKNKPIDSLPADYLFWIVEKMDLDKWSHVKEEVYNELMNGAISIDNKVMIAYINKLFDNIKEV